MTSDFPDPKPARVSATIESKVLRYSKENSLLPAGSKLVIGISGGPDSSALLLILSRLASKLDLRLVAAYFDHQLRGASAAAAERSAAVAVAERAAVELVCGSG